MKNNPCNYLKDPKKRLEIKKEYLNFLKSKIDAINLIKHDIALNTLGDLIDIIT